MLAKGDSGLLLVLLAITLVVAIVVIIAGTILGIAKARKKAQPILKTVILNTIGSIIIVAISWILNFGWLRFFMTLVLVPIIHSVIFFLSNMFFAKYKYQSLKMSKLNLLFIATYLIAYLLLPDGGDIGEMYFFFGLIHSNIFSDIASFISSVAWVIHIILLVMQILEVIKIKKNLSKS